MPTTLQGTENADVLVGGSDSEVLLGLGGDDQLIGGSEGTMCSMVARALILLMAV
jgi:hypothetical protein